MAYQQPPGYPQGGGYPGAHGGYPGQPQHHSPYPGQAPPPGPGPAHGGHAPAPAHGGASNIATTGQVEGAQFRIDHRDSNSMLALRLQPGYQVKAKPGSMVAMDASVQIRGKFKFSLKKAFTGGEVRGAPRGVR